MTENGIRIAVVVGAVRPGNYTSRAASLVVRELESQDGVAVDVVDPARLDLPEPGTGSTPDAEWMREIVGRATGVVLATPEYHGGFSSVIKRVIENLGFPSGLAGKPVALLGVAAGSIGAIKSLEALRSVCSHVGGLVLPGSVSVAKVREAFDDEGRPLDPKVEARIRGLATDLLGYIGRHVCPSLTLEAEVRAEPA